MHKKIKKNQLVLYAQNKDGNCRDAIHRVLPISIPIFVKKGIKIPSKRQDAMNRVSTIGLNALVYQLEISIGSFLGTNMCLNIYQEKK